jgi:uncharacterized protein DUF5302
MPLTTSDRVFGLWAPLTVWYEEDMGDQESAEESTAVHQTTGEDETRRKFRAALDRKHQQHHATAEAAARDGAEKSHGAQGPTKARTFRRKSV